MHAGLPLPAPITSLADTLGGSVACAWLYEISPGLQRISELTIDLPGVGHAVFFLDRPRPR